MNEENKKAFKWMLRIGLILFTTSGFMMFICEEAMQMASFGSFAYAEAKDWNGLENHLELMKSVDSVCSFLIISLGWMNPIMYPAYLTYLEVNEGYIESVESRIRAKA